MSGPLAGREEAHAFRYHSFKELEEKLDAAATTLDWRRIVTQYTSRNAEAKARLRCVDDVRYGPKPEERCDIYPPRDGATGGRPVVVFVHGGYWRMLEAADSGFMAETFIAGGACFVALGYPLALQANLGHIVSSCHAALVWLHANIAQYGGDPRRFHLIGHSAGAHLAAMMASKDWDGGTQGSRPDVQSVTLLSGLYDLVPLIGTKAAVGLELTPQMAVALSPIRALPAAGIPVILTYAQSETEEFQRQSEAYLAACQAVGCEASFVAVPGSNHFDIVFSLCDGTSMLRRKVLDQSLG